MPIRRLALLDGLLLVLMYAASRLALLIHEVIGHGLPAKILGATKIRLELSIFGGGYVLPTFPPGRAPSGFGDFVFHLGGIAMNLATGALAWWLARRAKRGGAWHVFLLFLGAGSFGQALFYLGNGFYFGTGDPQGFASDMARVQWMWTLFVPAMGVVAWFAARSWVAWLREHAPVDTFVQRAGWSAATVGVATAAYLGLWAATWDVKVDRTLSELRLEQEVRKEIVRRTPPRPPPPPISTGTPQPPAPPSPPRVVVRPEEVKDRVPPPVASVALLLAAAVGALLALKKKPPALPPGA